MLPPPSVVYAPTKQQLPRASLSQPTAHGPNGVSHENLGDGEDGHFTEFAPSFSAFVPTSGGGASGEDAGDINCTLEDALQELSFPRTATGPVAPPAVHLADNGGGDDDDDDDDDASYTSGSPSRSHSWSASHPATRVLMSEIMDTVGVPLGFSASQLASRGAVPPQRGAVGGVGVQALEAALETRFRQLLSLEHQGRLQMATGPAAVRKN